MTTNRYGILVQNCPKDTIRYNVVENANVISNAGYEYFHGIAVQTSTETYLRCNDITKFGYGISFTGYCNNSKIILNDMTACYSGIRLESATIGTQGTLAQPWDNRWYTSAGPNRISGTPAVVTNWYYRTTNTAYLITPYSVSPPQYIVPVQSNSSTIISCGIIPFINNPNIVLLPDSNKNDMYYADLNLLRNVDESLAIESITSATTPDILLIVEAVSAFEEGDNTEFEEKTDRIVSSELQAINHVTVNKILAHFSETGVLTASDSIVLLDIAIQDPVEGGEAVYTAKVLLGVQYVTTYPDVNNRKTLIQFEKFNLKVYPNPVDNELTVEIEFSSEFLLQVFSIDGKLIMSRNVNSDNNIHIFDVSCLEKGFYRLKIIDKLTGTEQNAIFAKE